MVTDVTTITRALERIVPATSTLDGGGFEVYRPTHRALLAGDLAIDVAPDAPDAFDAFVLTGEPIGEPMARYGPFVMNTRAEIVEAIDDFNAGRMGSIPATGTT
jgi:redox-sensitive bicupin YhaK (pirin superfamily)